VLSAISPTPAGAAVTAVVMMFMGRVPLARVLA
jgi:hypothetical protein